MPSESEERLTVLIPAGIGLAAKYKKVSSTVDGASFVRLSKKGSLSDGNLLLELTMNQMVEICRTSKSLRSRSDRYTYRHHLLNVKSRYDDLITLLRNLEQEYRATNFFEFSKKKDLHRETKELCDAGRRLYVSAKSTSDDLRRAVIAFDIRKIERVKGEIPANEKVTGVSLRLDGPIDEETASLIAETASLLTTEEEVSFDQNPANNVGDPTPLVANLAAAGWDVQDIASVSSPPRSATPFDAVNPASPAASLATGCVAQSNSNSSVPNTPSNTGTDNAPMVVRAATDDVPVDGIGLNVQPSTSPSSPVSPHVYNVFHGGTHNHYNSSMHNTNSQGPTQIHGGTDHGGSVVNGLPQSPPS